jgi:hypothetical protein
MVYTMQCSSHAFKIHLFPPEDVRDTRNAPPNTHNSDESRNDLNNHHNGNTHQHTRHENAIQHQMPPQPRSLNNRRNSNSRIEQHMRSHGASNPSKETRVLGPSLPERDGRDGDGAENLWAEGVEDDNERAEGVPDGFEGDESCLPLDGGEDCLVAGFEKIVASEQGEDSRA